MPFNNPIVGSGGDLVRDWIQSVNFVSGSAGWRISQNGDAEFNGITLRANLYIQGSDGSYIRAGTFGSHADILLRPTNSGTTVWNAARITADLYQGLFSIQPSLSITGPWESAGNIFSAPPRFLLVGPTDLDDNSIIAGFAVNTYFQGFSFVFDATFPLGSFPYGGQFNIDGAILSAASHVYGSASIVPVLNTPTSLAVTGFQAEGNTFYGYCTPLSTAPGDGAGNTVRMFSVSGVTATGITLWIYRGGTTATTIYYQVIGQL
jgi:hypothetical protein